MLSDSVFFFFFCKDGIILEFGAARKLLLFDKMVNVSFVSGDRVYYVWGQGKFFQMQRYCKYDFDELTVRRELFEQRYITILLSMLYFIIILIFYDIIKKLG